MIKRKYEFSEVFYSHQDDNETKEEEDSFRVFLELDNSFKTLFISIIKDNKKIIGLRCDTDVKLKKYLFIEGALAGVGIDYFIIKTNDLNICDKLEDFFSSMSLKTYYHDDRWIEEIFDLNIHKLYMTDCDGYAIFTYEKDESCSKI